jgi:hypothetical protein
VIFGFALLPGFLAICSAKVGGGRPCSAGLICRATERFLRSVAVCLGSPALLAASAWWIYCKWTKKAALSMSEACLPILNI